MNSGVFLQVRLDSTRLPGKALKPLAGLEVIRHAMRSLSKVKVPHHVLVTTPCSQEALKPIAEEEGWSLFVGNKEDVLDRYYQACRFYQVEDFIRATGDNPLVSFEWAQKVLEYRRDKGGDYCGFLGIPIGTGVEAVAVDALERAWRESYRKPHREHVLPYLYENPRMFHILRPLVPRKVRFWDYRLTLDTEEDYHKLQRVFNSLYKGSPISYQELIRWIQNQ